MTLEEILASIDYADFGYTEESVPKSVDHFNHWIDKNDHLPLHYLSGERGKKRQSMLEHWPDFQSAIVFIFSYDDVRQNLKRFYHENPLSNGLKVASYTLGYKGDDYHDYLRHELITIGEKLKSAFNLDYKLTLDTHPVLERDLAFRAGMGWFGKNSMMISRDKGSFFIIGSLLLNKTLPLKKKTIETDHCGQCTRCIDACPTEAIDRETRTIKAQDCISTFTIEQFKLDTPVPATMDLRSGFIFGCDICQDVCPWNIRQERIRPANHLNWNDKQLEIMQFFLQQSPLQLKTEIDCMSGKQFEKKFKKTSFERSGKKGLLKNIQLYLKQAGS